MLAEGSWREAGRPRIASVALGSCWRASASVLRSSSGGQSDLTQTGSTPI
jgi:hypothetical protein